MRTMWRTGIPAILLLGAFVGAAAAPPAHKLVARWRDPASERAPHRKLIVLAIHDDRETRHRFEEKFVSHLRGRGIEGVPSYSIAPDLTSLPSRAAVLAAIEEQEIDGAISVRLVPLLDLTEQDWATSWAEGLEERITLRTLIEDTIPVPPMEAKRYGVEVAFWNEVGGGRTWAARTDLYTRKELKKRKSGGDLVQIVMLGLWEAGLF